MTDEGAPFQPGTEQGTVTFRPRSVYAGYKAFGSGDGAALLEPEVARELRSVAEFATQRQRAAGGLLFGRRWADDQGLYLVVDAFLEAGPGEGAPGAPAGPGSPDGLDDLDSADGPDDFALTEAGLERLRQDAARMHSASLELGWWRTRPALSEFSRRDLATQGELVGPDGIGLLVYGSGIHWGAAYLGPDGRAPDAAGTLVATPEAAPEPPADPELAMDPGGAMEQGPQLVDIAAGESLAEEPLPPEFVPPGTPPPGRARQRRPAGVRAWAARKASESTASPGTPADVQFVVGALAVAVVAVAIIIGALVHSLVAALIIAAIGLLAVFSSTWMARR